MPKKKRRKPKRSPFVRLSSDLAAAMRRFGNAMEQMSGEGFVASSLQVNKDQKLYLYTFIGRIEDSEEYVAPLFAGLIEACRG